MLPRRAMVAPSAVHSWQFHLTPIIFFPSSKLFCVNSATLKTWLVCSVVVQVTILLACRVLEKFSLKLQLNQVLINLKFAHFLWMPISLNAMTDWSIWLLTSTVYPWAARVRAWVPRDKQTTKKNYERGAAHLCRERWVRWRVAPSQTAIWWIFNLTVL